MLYCIEFNIDGNWVRGSGNALPLKEALKMAALASKVNACSIRVMPVIVRM